MVIARHALTAVHATARRPADPDALSDLQPLGRSSDLDDSADGSLSFTAEVDIRPQIDLPDLDGIAVTVDDTEVVIWEMASELAN